MKLSNRAIYGIRALFDLAYHGGTKPVQIREVAEREAIPLRFLEQILQDLKRAELVESKRGPKGGYVLAHAAADVTLKMALEALEDAPEYAAPNGEDAAAREGSDEPTSWQVTDVVFTELFAQWAEQLGQITLADLMNRGEALGVSSECYERFTYVI